MAQGGLQTKRRRAACFLRGLLGDSKKGRREKTVESGCPEMRAILLDRPGFNELGQTAGQIKGEVDKPVGLVNGQVPGTYDGAKRGLVFFGEHF